MTGAQKTLILSVVFELLLVVMLILGLTNNMTLSAERPVDVVLTILGLVLSNLASMKIVGYIIINVLWPKLDTGVAHRREMNRYDAGYDVSDQGTSSENEKPSNLTWHQYWIMLHRGSPLSRQLGFAERMLLFIAGLHSLTSFFAVAGAWMTIKIAVDWSMLKELPHRGIGHIYLIGCLYSVFLGLLDVLVVRGLYDLPLQIRMIGCR